MGIIKRISIFILAFILFSSNVYANIVIIETEKVNVKITGIYDEIEKIELYTYGKEVDFDTVFNGTFDRTNLFSEEANNAYFIEEVDPFGKEKYVPNSNYDDKKYKVTVSYTYTYKFIKEEEETEIEYAFNKKFSDIKELKDAIRDKKYHSEGCTNTDLDTSKYNTELEKYMDTATLKCERSISYNVIGYSYTKDLSTSLIKDHTMEFSLDDFPKIDFYGRTVVSSYMIRFFPKNGISHDFIIGNNEIVQDSYIQTRPTVKNVDIEYSHNYVGEVVEHERTLSEIIKDNIVKIIIAIVFTIVIELALALLMKIKKLGIVGITNLVTQLILHCVTILLMTSMSSIPMYFYIIAEVLIVLVEFGVYALLIKDVTKKKLLLYSILANAVTFGLSFIINYM